MDALYRDVVKPILFRMDPEEAHERSVNALALLGRLAPLCRALEAINRLDPAAHLLVLHGADDEGADGRAARADRGAGAVINPTPEGT